MVKVHTLMAGKRKPCFFGVVRVDGFHAMGGHGLEFILRCLRQLLGGKSDTLSVYVCLWGSETA